MCITHELQLESKFDFTDAPASMDIPLPLQITLELLKNIRRIGGFHRKWSINSQSDILFKCRDPLLKKIVKMQRL